MIKVLHTGDIHLGDLNGPVINGRNARREDTLRAIDALTERAAIERPDVSIIAGDIINRSRVWADTALEDVNDIIVRLIRPLCAASLNVALLFGTDNHDNARAFDVIREATKDERNLTIYTKPTVHLYDNCEERFQLIAMPGFDKGRLRAFRPTADKEDEMRSATALVNEILLGMATNLTPGVPAILTAHYTVSGSEADNGTVFLAGQDTVVLPSTIDAMGLTLACFGHIHHAQRLATATPAFYCGSINQLTFNDENNASGFFMHSIGDTVESSFVELPQRRHYTYNMTPDDTFRFIASGDIKIPPDARDAIVRVRYACTPEQDKSFNRAELQHCIMAAGAFHVAEIIPDLTVAEADEALTEHDGPEDALRRYLTSANITDEDARRLIELATPIIREADDGRDADRHTGAFRPLKIVVHNYRSYIDAEFDFEAVQMAMVNGANGVGKSSLFMDAIADCLYEKSRSEEIGGWVRDGTKSGAITFEFAMGDARFRVARTRTKAGRGTLALQSIASDGTATDASDTTARGTQERIERLLGMDAATFGTIALIRQDAYGLFLDASSDRRMEVLSALLGLDIYGRMEETAKTRAAEKRKVIASLHDRVEVLQKQIETRTFHEERLKDIDDGIARNNAELSTIEAAVTKAQEADAAYREQKRTLDALRARARDIHDRAFDKGVQINTLTRRLEVNIKDANLLPAAEDAAKRAAVLRDTLAQHEGVEVQYDHAITEARKASDAYQSANDEISRLHMEIESCDRLVARTSEIESAIRQLETVRAKSAALDERFAAFAAAREAVLQREAEAAALAKDAQREAAERERLIAHATQQAAKIENSGCINPARAFCVFLADAHKEADAIETMKADLEAWKAQRRADYTAAKALQAKAVEELQALGNPSEEARNLKTLEDALTPTAALHASIQTAAARRSDFIGQIAKLRETASASQSAQTQALSRAKSLESTIETVRAAREKLGACAPLADKLATYKAAAATCEGLEHQIAVATDDKQALDKELADVTKQSEDMTEYLRALSADNTLPALTDRRAALLSDTNELSVRRGLVLASIQAEAEAERQAAEYRAQVAAVARDLNDYQTLTQAFGLDGIQYMIIRSVVPEFMRRANDILSAMTGGRMAVDIRTEAVRKSDKKVVKTLDVWIHSSTSSGDVFRPYQSHSGGEKVKIALAVTLALADVKARRAGLQLGMLFIDEPPFLDADGTEAYADALSAMSARNPAMRILAISHDPTMKARFPQNITVSATDAGSVVNM